MAVRWRMLAVLFVIRVSMAFQFQSVAALSPLIMDDYGVGLADIGLLIGLYLSPGIVIAFPGGAIGKRFGDKLVVACAMGLMLAGGLLIAFAPAWEAQIAGRLIAGVGGVVLNVLMSKMTTDWFAGRDLATAMGIFVNSWPVGIALALLVLPYIAASAGLAATLGCVAALVAGGLVLLLTTYRQPPGAGLAGAAAPAGLKGAALTAVMISGSMWGLYNAALSMVFGFGPAMLAERGWSATAASSTTSIVLWIVALSVPLGGFLADRLGRRDLVIGFGVAASAILMFGASAANETVAIFVALGIVIGLAAGPIMSLPGKFLAPGNRATGMGLFFTLFYVAVMVAPIGAGLLAEAAGTAGVAFTLGGAMLLACLILLILFRRLEAQTVQGAGRD